ncbi:hypothetical protein K1719_030036 [Acacia pycnantha]|nr:hypothetical protein K1719_030036 [Acacia pycnantha]
MLPSTLAIPALVLVTFLVILFSTFSNPKHAGRAPQALAAELFLKTHDTVFASRPDVQASDPLSTGTKGLVLFAEYGPYWRYVRKVCTLHLLSASRVQMFAPLRRAGLGSTVKSLQRAAAAREVVNLSEAAEDLIEETIYKMILGRGKDDRFNLKGLIKDQLSLIGQFNMADYVPWLGAFDFQGLTRKLRRNHKASEDVLEMIVTEHEQAAREQTKQNHNKDFMHTMLSLIHQPMELQDHQNHFLIDRDHLKVILIDMIFAAADTSIVVIDFVFSEPLRHPTVMKNLQNDVVCFLLGDALNALRTSMANPNNVLQSWDPTLVNPYTWFHVTCNSDNSVTRVDIGNANLSGQLVPQLGQLSNLQYL